MNLEQRIKELEEKLEVYEKDHAAEFYKSLVKAVKHIQTKLDDKTLDFKDDAFANSVVLLADKSGKIFEGLRIGKEAFSIEKKDSMKEKATSKVEADGGRSGF